MSGSPLSILRYQRPLWKRGLKERIRSKDQSKAREYFEMVGTTGGFKVEGGLEHWWFWLEEWHAGVQSNPALALDTHPRREFKTKLIWFVKTKRGDHAQYLHGPKTKKLQLYKQLQQKQQLDFTVYMTSFASARHQTGGHNLLLWW